MTAAELLAAPLSQRNVERLNDALPRVGRAVNFGGKFNKTVERVTGAEAQINRATTGVVAWNKHDAATNPTATQTVTIGSNVYEFVASGGSVAADTNIGVVREATADLSWGNLKFAVNATQGRTNPYITKTDGDTPALGNGTENVVAVHDTDGNTFYIFAANRPGGERVEGTTPDIACTDTITGNWSFANLNVSTGSGIKPYVNVDLPIPVTTAMISASPVEIQLPFYSTGTKVAIRISTTGGVLKEAATDSAAVTAGPDGLSSTLTLTLPGGGGDAANGDIAWISLSAPVNEGAVVPLSAAQAFGGQIDALQQAVATAQTDIDALESGRAKLFTFTGAGDQLSLATTAETPFLTVKEVPANAMGVDDWFEYEAEVLVDGVNSTPAFTIKMKLGTAILDTQVIATAAAADGVFIKGEGRITGATTLRNYRGQGYTKDGTVAYVTPIAPADLTIQALTSARNISVTATSDAGHASNLVTLKSFRLTLYKGS